jgi:glycosyltransferase involved in cell wall biosynthesis
MKEYESPLHVLWLVDHLGFNGKIHGAGMFYLNVIPAFNEKKFDLTLCVIRKKDNLHKYVEERGIKKIYYLGKGKFNPFTLFDLLKIVKREKIDIMHLHGYGADNFGRLLRVFVNIPTIVHTHDPFVYYPWFQKMIDTVLAGCNDATLAVSNSVKQATASKRKIPLKKIEVLHTCTPLDHFRPPTQEEVNSTKKMLGISHDFKVIGAIGRLFEQKGNEYLIRAIPIVHQGISQGGLFDCWRRSAAW